MKNLERYAGKEKCRDCNNNGEFIYLENENAAPKVFCGVCVGTVLFSSSPGEMFKTSSFDYIRKFNFRTGKKYSEKKRAI